MNGTYMRTEMVDHLEIDGESIALFGDRFVRLGPVGTHLIAIAGAPHTIDELAAALVDSFGAPAQGSSADATRAAVADLVAQGILQEVVGD